MTEEMDLIKQFIAEHPKAKFHIPEDYEILSEVVNTKEYIRQYFEWKGKRFMNGIVRDVINLTQATLMSKPSFNIVKEETITISKKEFDESFDTFRHKRKT